MKMTLHKCSAENCGSSLFVDWGLQVALTPANYEKNIAGEKSKYSDSVRMVAIKACATCQTPHYVDEGELVDASDLVSAEDVQATWNALQSMPAGGRMRTIDP